MPIFREATKRAVLLTMAVAVSVATVTMTGLPAASGDVECRYAVPISTPGPGDVTVVDLPADTFQHVKDVDYGDLELRRFDLRQPRWSVVAIRPSAEVDYDLAVHDCPDRRALSRSTSPGATVDFVALDGSRSWSQTSLFAVIGGVSRIPGWFGLEYSTGDQGPEPGEAQTLVMEGTPALVRDVYVDSGGTATLTLGILSGDADLAVVDVGDGEAGWTRARHEVVALSANRGTLAEVITVNVPTDQPGRTFGVVVLNNVSDGEYVLARH